MSKLDDVAHADASVVHVPTKRMAFKQAKDFRTLLGCEAGRRKLLLWLMHNDPLVYQVYYMATNTLKCESEEEVNKAVIIQLVNALINCHDAK